MKVFLSRYVEAGLNRGGEDLFLRVTITSEVEPQHAYLTAGLPQAVKAALAALPTDADSSDGTDLWVDEGLLRSHPTEYEFELEPRSEEEVLQMVQSAAFDGAWKQDYRTKEYSVTKDFYIDGNAD